MELERVDVEIERRCGNAAPQPADRVELAALKLTKKRAPSLRRESPHERKNKGSGCKWHIPPHKASALWNIV